MSQDDELIRIKPLTWTEFNEADSLFFIIKIRENNSLWIVLKDSQEELIVDPYESLEKAKAGANRLHANTILKALKGLELKEILGVFDASK